MMPVRIVQVLSAHHAGDGFNEPRQADVVDDRQVEQVCAGAGTRIAEIELNALVQMVDVTDDAEQSLAREAELIGDGMTATELAEIPYVLIGTVDEIADEILRARDRWGITYFAVRALDDFAPVIARVRELEA